MKEADRVVFDRVVVVRSEYITVMFMPVCGHVHVRDGIKLLVVRPFQNRLVRNNRIDRTTENVGFCFGLSRVIPSTGG